MKRVGDGWGYGGRCGVVCVVGVCGDKGIKA